MPGACAPENVHSKQLLNQSSALWDEKLLSANSCCLLTMSLSLAISAETCQLLSYSEAAAQGMVHAAEHGTADHDTVAGGQKVFATDLVDIEHRFPECRAVSLDHH